MSVSHFTTTSAGWQHSIKTSQKCRHCTLPEAYSQPHPLAALVFVAVVWIFSSGLSSGLEVCPYKDGGGVCPDQNTCCARTESVSACITHSHERDGPGVCCTRDDDDSSVYGFGCGAGFKCASSSALPSGHQTYHYCEETDSRASLPPKRQPRYALCSLPASAIGLMHGFPVQTPLTSVPLDASTPSTQPRSDEKHLLAYYSTMGSITSKAETITEHQSKIKAVVIIIHGSGRNADDYLCTMSAAINLQTVYPSDEVLVLAPRYLSEDDMEGAHRTQFMMWNITSPIAHTWRYGANALPPSQEVSSYDAMDAIVEHFALDGNGRYPLLERIIVSGHSAGGQFAHRWAMTSGSSAWRNPEENTFSQGLFQVELSKTTKIRHRTVAETSSQKENRLFPQLRVVVANPRSYCYLDSRRFVKNGSSFETPKAHLIEQCPGYDEWEWGLQNGGRLPTPYKDRALARVNGDIGELAAEYSLRHVVYLSGAQDLQSLNGSCEDDDFQGKSRRERSRMYYEALQIYFGPKEVHHKRLVVECVGHDHALMFQSSAGLEAMFSPWIELSTNEL